MFKGGLCLRIVIAVAGGSFSKQMTLNVDLDLSEVNSDIWRRYWTSVSNYMKIRLLL